MNLDQNQLKSVNELPIMPSLEKIIMTNNQIEEIKDKIQK